MKKKIFYPLNVVLILATLTSLISLSIYSNAWLSVLFTVLMLVFAGVNLTYVFIYKDTKTRLSAILIIVGILLAIIGNFLIIKNPIAFFIVLCLSEIAFIASVVLNAKFSKLDVLYVVAIALPMLLFVNFSHLFGFSNALNRFLVSLLMVLISGLLGLSISHLIKNKVHLT